LLFEVPTPGYLWSIDLSIVLARFLSDLSTVQVSVVYHFNLSQSPTRTVMHIIGMSRAGEGGSARLITGTKYAGASCGTSDVKGLYYRRSATRWRRERRSARSRARAAAELRFHVRGGADGDSGEGTRVIHEGERSDAEEGCSAAGTRRDGPWRSGRPSPADGLELERIVTHGTRAKKGREVAGADIAGGQSGPTSTGENRGKGGLAHHDERADAPR